MGQAVIENQALTVAAVDPATYRLFTPAASADTQDVWDRVAGGELALRPELRRKLPKDKDDYLAARQRRRRARGAHRRLRPAGRSAVDAVVNEKWGEELGIPPGNALLVSPATGRPSRCASRSRSWSGRRRRSRPSTSPPAAGIDPGVQQTAFVVGTVAEAVGVFNYTRHRRRPDRTRRRPGCARTSPPRRCRSWATVTCNKLIFPQLEAALQDIVDPGPGRQDPPGEYAGCYYPRFIAGSTTLSNHSFGLALDLNVPGNQRGTVGEMDRDGGRDLQGVGLRLGWRLELHRPHALRDERPGRPARP